MSSILNPDKKVVYAIKRRLRVTNGQCPCISQEKWSEDTICPCKKFREEDECCCQLYVKTKPKEE